MFNICVPASQAEVLKLNCCFGDTVSAAADVGKFRTVPVNALAAVAALDAVGN